LRHGFGGFLRGNGRIASPEYILNTRSVHANVGSEYRYKTLD
jgi:hypothetical protein